MVSPQRKRLRLIIAAIAAVFFGFLVLDAMGVFKSEAYTALPHGGHAHYVPDDKDEGVDAAQCPTRAPGPDEFVSPQCQMIRTVRQGDVTYYVPDQADQGVPIGQFPTQAPGSGEFITPSGQVIRR